MKKANPIYSFFSIVSVSMYLGSVLIYLLAKGKVRPSMPLKNLVKPYFRRKYRGDLREFCREHGNCYLAPLPPGLISDKDGISRLVIFENDRPLAGPHSAHMEIREKGSGLYSHWGDYVYFSTTDNSDPANNGRNYKVAEV